MTGPYWLVFERPELANFDLRNHAGCMKSIHKFSDSGSEIFLGVGVHFEITPSKPKEIFRNKVEHHHESEDEGVHTVKICQVFLS